MRRYFQYICKKVPFWKVSYIEVGGSVGAIPDSGIWMVCYQEWWSEIGCYRLVVGTVRQVKRSGGLAAEWCQDVLGGSTGMADVLSELRWCRRYKIIIIIWCWCMVWWGVSAISGYSERYEIPCSLMTLRAMSRWMYPMSVCYRIAKTNPPHHCEGVSRKFN